MTLPTRNELVFAVKAYSGAMLALWIAFWLELDNPYWSMATAFIVAPRDGAAAARTGAAPLSRRCNTPIS